MYHYRKKEENKAAGIRAEPAGKAGIAPLWKTGLFGRTGAGKSKRPSVRAGAPAGTAGPGFIAASFTIEAAAVVPIALIAIASLISCGFALHDLLLSNFTANEAAELYARLPEEGSEDDIESYANSRLGALLTGAGYCISLEEYKDGSVVTVTRGGGSSTYTDAGFRPENFMRKVTVLEEVLGSD